MGNYSDISSDISIEEEFIFKCIAPEKTEYINRWLYTALTQEEMNWDYIIRLSLFHDVFPLVFDRLSKLGLKCVPGKVIVRLTKLWQEHMARNIILHSEYNHLMVLFSKEGVEVIPLKGVCWARQFYPDENLRSFNDLDFLVRSSDLDLADRLLKRYNYKPEPYINSDRSPENSWNLGFYKYLPGGKRICLELHWGLARPRDYSIPLKQWWRNCRVIQVNGERALSFSLEDLLLYMAINIHASKYMYLKQFVDLQRFLLKNQDKLDWPYIEKSAKVMGIWNNLCFAIYMVDTLFENDHRTVIVGPIRLEQSIRIKVVKKLLGKQEIMRGTYSDDLRQFFLLLILNDRLNQVMKSTLRTFFPSLEATAYRYYVKPDSRMVYLLYFLNPFLSILRIFLKIPAIKGFR